MIATIKQVCIFRGSVMLLGRACGALSQVFDRAFEDVLHLALIFELVSRRLIARSFVVRSARFIARAVKCPSHIMVISLPDET